MKKFYISFLAGFILIIYSVNAQTIQTKLRFSNSLYVYEGKKLENLISSNDEKVQHIRLYQNLRFHAKLDQPEQFQFNTSMRMLSDLGDDGISDERKYNLHRLSISGKNLFNNFLDFEIGRQFLHPGLNFGSLDGLNLLLKPINNLDFQFYGGIESHLLHAFKIYEFDNAVVFGGRLIYKKFYNSNIQVLYFQKSRANKKQWQIGGFNLSNNLIKNFNFQGQAHYDLINNRFHRLYFSTSYLPTGKFRINAYVKQQYPQIYGDSFYRIFKVNKYLLSGANLSYNLTDDYYISGTAQTVIFDEGYGNRFLLSFSNDNGSISMTYETGDLGNQIGAILDYGYEILPDLTASICVDYSQYRFEEIYDFENQIANAFRLSYDLSKHWLIDAEYQWLNNKFNDSDHRFLNHIHFKW